MTLVALPEKDPEPFEEGDLVTLKSGGEVMTVQGCRKDKRTWWVAVDWINETGDACGVEYKAKQLMPWAPTAD